MDDRKLFTGMIKKIKTAAVKHKMDNFPGGWCKEGFCLYYTKNGYYVLSILDRNKTSVAQFQCNIDPNWGELASSKAYLAAIKKAKRKGWKLDKGELKSRNLEEFVTEFWTSNFASFEWTWDKKLDRRMGGKKGKAGRKSIYGGLETGTMKIPIIYKDEVKKILQFLVEHNGEYELASKK